MEMSVEDEKMSSRERWLQGQMGFGLFYCECPDCSAMAVARVGQWRGPSLA